jgi:hypothetical protein
MPTESSSSALSSGPASSSNKKRKRIELPEEPTSKQQKVSELVAPSQQNPAVHKPFNGKAVSKTQTPTQKHSRPSLREVNASATDTMYSFASNHMQRPDMAVDLTSASPPRKSLKTTLIGPQAGAKRIVVKNLRQPRSDPHVYYDQVALKLDAAVQSILRNEAQLPSSNEELYRGVENICKQGRDGDLYARLRSIMKRQAINDVKPKLEKQLSLHKDDPIPVLDSTLTEWKAWKDAWV